MEPRKTKVSIVLAVMGKVIYIFVILVLAIMVPMEEGMLTVLTMKQCVPVIMNSDRLVLIVV